MRTVQVEAAALQGQHQAALQGLSGSASHRMYLVTGTHPYLQRIACHTVKLELSAHHASLS
jgi:hypothetical protein